MLLGDAEGGAEACRGGEEDPRGSGESKVRRGPGEGVCEAFPECPLRQRESSGVDTRSRCCCQLVHETRLGASSLGRLRPPLSWPPSTGSRRYTTQPAASDPT